MKNAASRLIARLVAIQMIAWGATGLLSAAFAPRLLLLDASVVEGSARLALWGWGTTVVLVVLANSIGKRYGVVEQV